MIMNNHPQVGFAKFSSFTEKYFTFLCKSAHFSHGPLCMPKGALRKIALFFQKIPPKRLRVLFLLSIIIVLEGKKGLQYFIEY
ncbi:hypothetical protein D7X33_10455 [Butyricicoccus sp. 1XD8-22]|nr:hypothetical protein D7X33_10455 [Butyricicoccus sp. 1XD8-22]